MKADSGSLAVAIGARVRRVRKAAGLTLVQVADLSGLSQPYLSQAENGRAMMSVLSLHRIASAIGTTAHELLEEPAGDVPTSIVRSGEGRTYQLGEDAVLRFCAPSHRAMDLNEVTAAPGASAEAATSHAGEEGLYMLDGSIRFEIGGEMHELTSGDSVYYAAPKPHRWFNDSGAVARFLFMSTPPGF